MTAQEQLDEAIDDVIDWLDVDDLPLDHAMYRLVKRLTWARMNLRREKKAASVICTTENTMDGSGHGAD
jgi:hypothetical protein